MARFLGVDLAWAVDKKHTGVAVMDGDVDGVRLVDVSSGLRSLRGVVDFVAAQLASVCVVAIDASLIVRNSCGQRPCETAIGRQFGAFGASCHSTNQSRQYWNSGERLVNELRRYGFRHGLPLADMRRSPGRWLLEVYPHAAMVRVFKLESVIPYKKGRIPIRRAGLRRLQGYLAGLVHPNALHRTSCLDDLLASDPQGLKGAALKQFEDRLDAVFCAYLAWHCWREGEEWNEVFGDLETGYIVVPKAPWRIT